MKVRKHIRKRIRRDEDGVQVSADVNAVVAANVNEPGSKTHVSSQQSVARAESSAAGQREEREKDQPGE